MSVVDDTTSLDTPDDWIWNYASFVGNGRQSADLGATWPSGGTNQFYFQLSNVPEPASTALLLLGLALLGTVRGASRRGARRRRNRPLIS